MRERVDIGLVRRAKTAIIRRGIQRAFVSRLMRVGKHIRFSVIVSPWISSLEGGSNSIKRLAKYIDRLSLPTYVFTRPPATSDHLEAIQVLLGCPSVEIVYNPQLHAKVYACVGPQPYGFAILGSANMTVRSASLYEIGLLVLAGGGGDHVVKELAEFGVHYLRTRPDSQVVKKRSPRRSRDDV